MTILLWYIYMYNHLHHSVKNDIHHIENIRVYILYVLLMECDATGSENIMLFNWWRK